MNNEDKQISSFNGLINLGNRTIKNLFITSSIITLLLMLYIFVLNPLSKPILSITERSKNLTVETGIEHYQESVPIGNTILYLLIWSTPLGAMSVLLYKGGLDNDVRTKE